MHPPRTTMASSPGVTATPFVARCAAARMRAPAACSRTIRGVTHYGTIVKAHYSPKKRCGSAAKRIQHAMKRSKRSSSA